MENSIHSINKFFREIIADNLPDFTFHPEPGHTPLQYPCIVFDFDSILNKTETTHINKISVQVDVLVTDFERFKCDHASLKILRAIGLHNDKPGNRRRLPKYRFFDTNGTKLQTPVQIVNSDVLYNLGERLQRINEPEFPELMHNTFGIDFWATDEGV